MSGEPVPKVSTYLDVNDLMTLLRARGLTIGNTERAEHYLGVIGYHRLKNYARPFYQDGAELEFRSGVSFNDLIALYTLDREFRLHLMGPLEKIEVALRALIIQVLGDKGYRDKFGAPVFFSRANMNLGNRDNATLYGLLLTELLSVVYHSNPDDGVSRSTGRLTPARNAAFDEAEQKTLAANQNKALKQISPYSGWHLIHRLSFGKLSQLYQILRPDLAREIAQTFNMKTSILRSILKSLTKLRNRCAHHETVYAARLVAPKFPNNVRPCVMPADLSESQQNALLTKPYIACTCIHMFLGYISETTSWNTRLKPIIQRFPGDIRTDMGFPKDWEEYPFWNSPDFYRRELAQ